MINRQRIVPLALALMAWAPSVDAGAAGADLADRSATGDPARRSDQPSAEGMTS